MKIVRSLVNAEITLEDGSKKILSSGHNYEADKIELDPKTNLATIYFKDSIAKNIDIAAIEAVNTPIVIITPEPELLYDESSLV
jgi:hypothetical protein